ncbi:MULTISPECIES: hypothetical protein [Listeria]|uniref:hypothetical protein n=1 Tax=Listeria TaxID=1637 RepID=UPI000B598273|nr:MULTISPECIES: hypothetical protein [Listeria]
MNFIKKWFTKLYSKIRYSVMLSLSITVLYIISVFSLKFLPESSFFSAFYLISTIYVFIITVLMLGLMLAPTYQYSSKYLKEGIEKIITFEIQAFELDSKNSYKKRSTYSKLQKIKKSVFKLNPEERYLLLSYFEAKNNAPLPVLAPILSSFLLGLVGSSISGYFSESPVEMFGILYILFLLFASPTINWFVGNRQRKLTEQYIINLIKNAPSD